MQTEVIRIKGSDTKEVENAAEQVLENAFDKAIEKVKARLVDGDVVALPTETVYGLFALASSEKACETLYRVKRRPLDKPVSILVSSVAMAERVAEVGDRAKELFERYAPGALTLVLPCKMRAELSERPKLSSILLAGGDTIGIRIPDHPFILRLLEEMDAPLAASSANMAGGVSPTNVDMVLAELAGEIPLIVDGGETSLALASTVADLTGGAIRILREGTVKLEV